MGKFMAGMLTVVMVCAVAAPSAGAAEIPPADGCVAKLKGLMVELPDLGDATEAEYRKADRGFIKDLAATGCISDAEPLLGKVPLTPRSEQCQKATKAAEKFWKPHNAKFNILDREWNRIGAPMERKVRRLQSRIRQLREAGASTARINRVLQKRRAIGKKLHRYNERFQRRVEIALGPIRYESFLVLTELVALRCVDEDVFGGSKTSGPAARVIAKNYETVLLSLVYLADDPGGEFAVIRYFLSMDLD